MSMSMCGVYASMCAVWLACAGSTVLESGVRSYSTMPHALSIRPMPSVISCVLPFLDSHIDH